MPPAIEYYVNNQTKVSHTAYALTAGVAALQVSTFNPQRNYMLLHNAGGNVALWRFGAPADILTGVAIGAGNDREWFSIVPQDALFLFSAAGTTIIVIEGVRPFVG